MCGHRLAVARQCAEVPSALLPVSALLNPLIRALDGLVVTPPAGPFARDETIAPPTKRVQVAGRPQERRYPSAGERRGKTRKCSKCGEIGHRAKRCDAHDRLA